MSIIENKGFSLIEVMVAVFVLAIGLLGIAGLQLSGIKNNQTAYVRTQATELAHSLAERMRANVAGTETGDYLGVSALDVNGFSTMGSNNNCGLGYGTLIGTIVACTSTNMAQDDLYRWMELAKTSIPQPTAAVTCTTPAGVIITASTGGTDCPRSSTHSITISWNEQDTTNGLVARSMSTEFQP